MRLTKLSQVMIVGLFSLSAFSAQPQSSGAVAKVNGVTIPQSPLYTRVGKGPMIHILTYYWWCS